jgi:hypothetical protein
VLANAQWPFKALALSELLYKSVSWTVCLSSFLWHPEDKLFGSVDLNVDRDHCLDARLRPRPERTVCFRCYYTSCFPMHQWQWPMLFSRSKLQI